MYIHKTLYGKPSVIGGGKGRPPPTSTDIISAAVSADTRPADQLMSSSILINIKSLVKYLNPAPHKIRSKTILV